VAVARHTSNPSAISSLSHVAGHEESKAIVTWQDDHNLLTQKEELIEGIKELVGHEPLGVRVLLRVLAHPDLVQHTRRYFDELDQSTKCRIYEAPWCCAREAEAKYENIKYGWTGAVGGISFDEFWCEPCRRKVLGDG
jgi:hypothetical protein